MHIFESNLKCSSLSPRPSCRSKIPKNCNELVTAKTALSVPHLSSKSAGRTRPASEKRLSLRLCPQDPHTPLALLDPPAPKSAAKALFFAANGAERERSTLSRPFSRRKGRNHRPGSSKWRLRRQSRPARLRLALQRRFLSPRWVALEGNNGGGGFHAIFFAQSSEVRPEGEGG